MKGLSEIKIQAIYWWIIIILGSYLLVSCKTKYIEIPLTTEKEKYIIQKDTLYVRDSIHIEAKGDTVFKDKYRIIYRNSYTNDSVFIRDTIRVPYPVEKIIYQNKLKWYQEGLFYLGLVSFILFIGKAFIKK